MDMSLDCTESEKVYQINIELLGNIKKLETGSDEQQNVIGDQDQEIEYLNNKISYLRKSTKCYGNNWEEFDQKLNKLKQENVNLGVEGRVCQNKAKILNQNLEIVRTNCDKLYKEINHLHPQVEQIKQKIQEIPVSLSSVECCLQDPECPNFGEQLCTGEEEKKDRDEIRDSKLNLLQKMLSECKVELEKMKMCHLETEEQRKELESELESKMRYQQILDIESEDRKLKHELTANLREEMREEDKLCENCFRHNVEDKVALKEEKQDSMAFEGEEEKSYRNCFHLKKNSVTAAENIYQINVELLRNIKELEARSEEQQNLIGNQDQEIEHLNKKISYLRKSTRCYGNNWEEFRQKMNKLKQENVSLGVEGRVCQNIAKILQENLEILQTNCDKLYEEINHLHPEVEKIKQRIRELPIFLSSAECCLQDPECPNFGVKLCTGEAEKKDRDEVGKNNLNLMLKMLSACKIQLEKMKMCLLETEKQRKELESELESKMRYQQILDFENEGKKLKCELTANLWEEMREEDRLCENCLRQNREDKQGSMTVSITLSICDDLADEEKSYRNWFNRIKCEFIMNNENQQYLICEGEEENIQPKLIPNEIEEQKLCSNCSSRIEPINRTYWISFLKKPFLVNFNVSQPRNFSKIFASLCKSLNSLNRMNWIELLRGTSIVSLQGGEYYLSLISNDESFPCNFIK